MKFTSPHWLTVVFAAVGVCAGALAPMFPNYAVMFSLVAGICSGLSAPTISPAPAATDAATAGPTEGRRDD